jgi:hypothetical protein
MELNKLPLSFGKLVLIIKELTHGQAIEDY